MGLMADRAVRLVIAASIALMVTSVQGWRLLTNRRQASLQRKVK
jgi:hypothetical protein